MKASRRAAAVTVAMSAVALVGSSLSATATSDPVKNAPAPKAPTTKTCTAPVGGANAKSEFLSCLGVSASLDRLPSVGQTARLTVTVKATDDVSASTSIELPASLEWVGAPAGMTTKSGASTRPETKGRTHTASASGKTLAKGASVTYTGTVRATAAGSAQITVTAQAPMTGGMDANSASVFLTVAEKGKASAAGVASQADGAGNSATAAVPAGAKIVRSAGTRGLPSAANNPSAPCDSRATGLWTFQDGGGIWRGGYNMVVQVWNKNVLGDSKIAEGWVGADGAYNLCFDSADTALFESGTADIYMRFVTENNRWKVVRGGSPLAWATGVVNNIVPGSTTNFGNLTTGDPALHRGLSAYDSANKMWQWLPIRGSASCWDAYDTSCRQVVINWAPDSTDGTYYSLGANDVHLAANDPNSRHTVIHEMTHALMDDVYEDVFPAAPNCSPHYVNGASSQGCAWTEGFAEWAPAQVLNDPYYRWASGSYLALETPTWGTAGWANGDSVEGRVAGALIDFSDSTNEAPYDTLSEGNYNIWDTFLTRNSTTLYDFMLDMSSRGHTWTIAHTAALNNNTIDYNYREPLVSGAGVYRNAYYTVRNYRAIASRPYWQVVGVKPLGSNDLDLRVYTDYSQSTLGGYSTYSGNAIDFMAINTNRLPINSSYYPRVNSYSGAGDYAIQYDNPGLSLSVGTPQTVRIGSVKFSAVRDAYLQAGVTYTISATPLGTNINPDLFLLSSTGTLVGRSSAMLRADAKGNGLSETITVTPTATGWYGLVLTNKAAYGSVTLSLATASGAPVAPAPAK